MRRLCAFRSILNVRVPAGTDMTIAPLQLARSQTLAGTGFMVLGIFLFCCNDALGKWLLGNYSVWQMLMIRSIAALVILTPLIVRAGAAPFAGAARPALQMLRVTMSVAESIMFFWAVTYLPLADTVTFY